jgi:hypothetical protein
VYKGFVAEFDLDRNFAVVDVHSFLDVQVSVVWTSLGPLPRWVPGSTTRWAPGTTRLALHGT